MRRRRIIGVFAATSLAVSGLVAAASAEPTPGDEETNLAKLVNTFIGTQDQGNTYPGATAPFGMTQVSPTSSWFSGYSYEDARIYGFSTQSISGAGCWEQGGVLPIQPTTGEVGPGKAFNTSQAQTFNYRNYGSTYTHEGEVGEAGYYRTMLTSFGGINVETTATPRVGVQRYTFPETPNANLFFNSGQANGAAGNVSAQMKIRASSIAIDDDGVITGEVTAQGFCSGRDYTYKQYFASQIDTPISSFGSWTNSDAQEGRSEVSSNSQGLQGIWVTLDTTESQEVQVSTAISYTSVEGAKKNLEAEGKNADGTLVDFDEVREGTQADWNEYLSRIKAQGGSSDDQTVFYTALYHSLTQPSLATDVDGKYYGFDNKIHTAEGWEYYQYFSLWDTFRTQNQLLAAFYPERAKDLGRSILTIEAQGGWLPRWAYASYETNTMAGDPVTAYIADLWRYGAFDSGESVVLQGADTLSGEPVSLDESRAFEAVLRNVDETPPADSQFAGRAGNESYIPNGYIAHNPSANKKGMSDDRRRAGSSTMEYAVSDCGAGVMAAELGQSDDARRLADRAGNWLNVWDPTVSNQGFEGFPRSRRTETSWSSFSATGAGSDSNGFEEGTPWQYQFLTMQDTPGFVNAVGGMDQAMKRLDTFFDTSKILDGTDGWKTLAKNNWVSGALNYSGAKYNPNNEPDLHAPMYYSYLGEPAKTSAIIRTAQKLFTNAPNGVTGNDDLGTMSAWYVLSAVGLYPGIPGTGEMVVIAPKFEQIDIDLGDDKSFTIKAPNASKDKLQFIDAVSLNGVALEDNWVSIDDVLAGGNFEVTLTEESNADWGQGAQHSPVPVCSSEVVFRGDERVVAAGEPLEGKIGTLVGPGSKLENDATASIEWADETVTPLDISTGLVRELTVSEPAGPRGAGIHEGTVFVRSADGNLIGEYPFSYEEKVGLTASVDVQGRCVAGKVVLAVKATNTNDAAVEMEWATPYGSKAFPDVAPGKVAAHAFSVRNVTMDEGSATLRLKGTLDGESIQQEIKAEIPSMDCSK